ncbi:hypothetical protein TI10_07345 [Photorhabdus luminescens subsp. luminescens]|nr:hypothetical protein TI10_07345 [Photorhabdus luminescens subsp. luminescens]
MTGVSECSQQRGNLKDNGYNQGGIKIGRHNAKDSSFNNPIKNVVYPMDFKMHRDGKGVNPREHSKLCDRGERVQPTKRQLER